MYTPYVVVHHPLIPYLGSLHRPPSRLPYSIFLYLIPPEAILCSSSRMSEHMRIGGNHRSNLLNNRRRYSSSRREEVAELGSKSVHDSLIQSE